MPLSLRCHKCLKSYVFSQTELHWKSLKFTKICQEWIINFWFITFTICIQRTFYYFTSFLLTGYTQIPIYIIAFFLWPKLWMLLSGAQLIYRHTIPADIMQKLVNDNSSKGIDCSSDNCMLQNTVRLF